MMENNALNTPSTNSNRVVLELLGIDKKWIKGKNGQWIDEREEHAQFEVRNTSDPEAVEAVEAVEAKKTSNWWQFWRS